ncbi:hypothetical protein [Pseudomonas frederiksbergensis]|nr:hypothetical protein [Pseudomonas frederiksbergensis]MDR7109228.1 hypothetical protein [Pseudomonas frederiksbergensis]
MKPIFWLLTAGLVVVMLAYNVIRDAFSVCQPPQYSHQVFR